MIQFIRVTLLSQVIKTRPLKDLLINNEDLMWSMKTSIFLPFICKVIFPGRLSIAHIFQRQKRIIPACAFGFHFLVQRQLCISVKMECCGNACGPEFSKEALKQRLTAQQYQVTQEKETERAFTGKYYKHFEKGTYMCVVCKQDLFPSESKYDSKCGWPAFFDTVDSSCVKYKQDLSHDMKRTEVLCSKCGAHLGHVFDDGPKPTGKRFCVNSAALDFRKSEEPSSPNSSS